MTLAEVDAMPYAETVEWRAFWRVRAELEGIYANR
jgi:hypothetical protein